MNGLSEPPGSKNYLLDRQQQQQQQQLPHQPQQHYMSGLVSPLSNLCVGSAIGQASHFYLVSFHFTN
jgi:hypothetical protein